MEDSQASIASTRCRITTCVNWVARRSAGDDAEFIGKSQSTYGCADTKNYGGQCKGEDGQPYFW